MKDELTATKFLSMLNDALEGKNPGLIEEIRRGDYRGRIPGIFNDLSIQKDIESALRSLKIKYPEQPPLEERLVKLSMILELRTKALQDMIETYQYEASLENPSLLAAKEACKISFDDIMVLSVDNIKDDIYKVILKWRKNDDTIS